MVSAIRTPVDGAMLCKERGSKKRVSPAGTQFTLDESMMVKPPASVGQAKKGLSALCGQILLRQFTTCWTPVGRRTRQSVTARMSKAQTTWPARRAAFEAPERGTNIT